jgi:hypothetical protein
MTTASRNAAILRRLAGSNDGGGGGWSSFAAASEIRHHVGKAFVWRAAQREADAALWIVVPEFHQSSPLLDGFLGRDPQ